MTLAEMQRGAAAAHQGRDRARRATRWSASPPAWRPTTQVERFRVLNGLVPHDKLKPGDLVKVVVE